MGVLEIGLRGAQPLGDFLLVLAQVALGRADVGIDPRFDLFLEAGHPLIVLFLLNEHLDELALLLQVFVFFIPILNGARGQLGVGHDRSLPVARRLPATGTAAGPGEILARPAATREWPQGKCI